jgi:hypothetical protein
MLPSSLYESDLPSLRKPVRVAGMLEQPTRVESAKPATRR